MTFPTPLRTPEALPRAIRCHAKRYMPPSRKQRPRGVTTDAERRKHHDAAGTEELLRELNSGGAGVLRDEDDQDWGLDDVAAHARARQQQQLERGQWESDRQRPQGSTRDPSAAAVAPGGPGRRRGRSEDLGAASPLASGLARIAPAEEVAQLQQQGRVGTAPGGGVDLGLGADGVGIPPRSAGGTGPAVGAAVAGRVGGAAAGAAAAAVVLEPSYARRNPQVVQALRRQGVVVTVERSDEAGDEDADGDADLASDREEPDLYDGITNSVDDVELDFDPSLGEDRWGPGAAGGPGSKAQQQGQGQRGGGSGEDGGAGGWYSGLAAAGFTVRTSPTGEVFLERTVKRSKAAAPGASAAPPPAAPSAAQPVSARAPAAAAGATPGTRAASPTATDAAAAGDPRKVASVPTATAAAGASGRLAAAAAAAAAAKAAAAARAKSPVPPLEPLTQAPPLAAALSELSTPQQVLDVLELSYPAWAANGYRLADQNTGRPVAAPSPAEAAHAIRALALCARRADIGGWRCLDLAAGRHVQGLAECLRVTPPRLLPEHATPQLSAAYFETARQYWLEAGGELLQGPKAGAAGKKASGGVGAAAGATSSSGSGGGGAGGGSGVVGGAVGVPNGGLLDDPLYDALVAKYAGASGGGAAAAAAGGTGSGGGSSANTSSSGSSTAGSSSSGSSNDIKSLRRALKVDCLVSALWGLSSLGGPPYFATEVEALMAILVRCLAAGAAAAAASGGGGGGGGGGAGWGALAGWQAGQVLWALGNSRHVTPRLDDLEDSILRASGLSAMQPRDTARVLWGFASLGRTPERLLYTLRPDWGWREQLAFGPAGAEGGRERSGRRRRDGKGKGGDVRDFTPQQLAGVVWSLAVMKQVDSLPFRSAWLQLLRRAPEVPPAEPVLTEVWQAALAIHLESADPAAATYTAAAAASGAASSPQASGGLSSSSSRKTTSGKQGASGAGGDTVTAALAAALATAAATPEPLPPGRRKQPRDGGGGGNGGGGSGLDVAAARSLLLRSRDTFLAATSGLRRRVQSGYQRQMANVLTALRVMHLLEDNSPGYSIDITLPQLRIAIEADGPSHTSRTPGGAMLGATAMKRRHLQRLGWQVINVPYKEWDKLASEASRKAYLQERINRALVNSIDVSPDTDGGAEATTPGTRAPAGPAGEVSQAASQG